MSILTDAEQIRDETTAGANTATRVGTNLVDIANALTITPNAELDLGSKTASFGVDFANDTFQKVTLTANTMTLTLDTTDVGVDTYILKIVNGGLATLTWETETGSILASDGTAPVLTASGYDLITLYFDGTDWSIVDTPNFTAI